MEHTSQTDSDQSNGYRDMTNTRHSARRLTTLLLCTSIGLIGSHASVAAHNDLLQHMQQEAQATMSQGLLHNADDHAFYQQVMNAAPILPADLSVQTGACGLAQNENAKPSAFKSAQKINYNEADWQTRVPHQWAYFSAPATSGKILVIDTKQGDQQIGYRYLANANTHNDIYEPWSSSKIMAFTGAVAKVRQLNSDVGAMSRVGDTYLADMITSINSYTDFGSAPEDSNALATYFANVAGRDYLTALFFDEWLQLKPAPIFFRGAYGPVAFVPSNNDWQSLQSDAQITVPVYAQAADDPGYLNYLCEHCGKTGNKAMSTLAQAEWLKRLALHNKETSTQHPYLTPKDIDVLLYGSSHSHTSEVVGGMMQGISNMLQLALAGAIANQDFGLNTQQAKKVLDEATQGKWRVFQKIGWGPSETRGTSENVVLAHVCLPNYQGGREFTLAAQVDVAGNSEQNVQKAGIKMQALLQQSMQELLQR